MDVPFFVVRPRDYKVRGYGHWRGIRLFVYLKTIEGTRIQAAERFIERWNKPDLRAMIDRTRSFVEGTIDSAQFGKPTFVSSKASQQDAQLRSDMIMILGFFEEIAIAVKTRSADEDRLKMFFLAVIPGGYDGFQGFILCERKQDKDSDYYIETQRLVERWTRVRRPDTKL